MAIFTVVLANAEFDSKVEYMEADTPKKAGEKAGGGLDGFRAVAIFEGVQHDLLPNPAGGFQTP